MHTIWNFALQKRYIGVHFSFAKAWWWEVEWNMVHVRNNGKDAGKEKFFPCFINRQILSTYVEWRFKSTHFSLCMLGEINCLHIFAAFPTPAGKKKKNPAGTFAECNQQDATLHNLFISVRRSTCFGRFFRPSSASQNCTYSVRYLSGRYCYLLVVWLG